MQSAAVVVLSTSLTVMDDVAFVYEQAGNVAICLAGELSVSEQAAMEGRWIAPRDAVRGTNDLFQDRAEMMISLLARMELPEPDPQSPLARLCEEARERSAALRELLEAPEPVRPSDVSATELRSASASLRDVGRLVAGWPGHVYNHFGYAAVQRNIPHVAESDEQSADFFTVIAEMVRDISVESQDLGQAARELDKALCGLDFSPEYSRFEFNRVLTFAAEAGIGAHDAQGLV